MAGKLEFAIDLDAHHFHAGRAISENPQISGIFGFTQQGYDGHQIAAIGRVLGAGNDRDGLLNIGVSYQFAAAKTFAEAHGNEIDAVTTERWRESELPIGPERA